MAAIVNYSFNRGRGSSPVPHAQADCPRHRSCIAGKRLAALSAYETGQRRDFIPLGAVRFSFGCLQAVL